MRGEHHNSLERKIIAMRKMNEKETKDLIREWSWCTIIGTDGNIPYAIEVTYVSDGEYMYCGSRPSGSMHTCLKKNNNLILKVCDASKTYPTWRAASVRGQAEFISDKDEMCRIMRMVAKVRGLEENHFDNVAEFISKSPAGSSLFKVPIKDISGVASN